MRLGPGNRTGYGAFVVRAAKTKQKRPEPVQLTGKQRSYLRSLAHSLEPVVQIGQAGLTAAVLKHVDESLVAHELIKIKVSRDAPLTIAEAEAGIVHGTNGTVAQVVGRVIVVYRPHPDQPHIQLPKRRPARKATARKAKAETANGSE
jgi:RNA-binding protein